MGKLLNLRKRVRGGIDLGADLTPELSEKLVTMRRTTRLMDTQVAVRCGISRQMLDRFMTLGLLPEAQEPYLSFAQEYSDAGVEVENEALEAVKKGDTGKMGGDWRADAWFLERFRPTRWGSKIPEGGAREALDTQTLVDEMVNKLTSLEELLSEPPPELEAAMLAPGVREKLLALLGGEPSNSPEPAQPSAHLGEDSGEGR